jgi:isopenicillin-N N-acyltransferase-like protein
MKPQTQLVTVKGSNYECGYQHGEQANKLVKRNIKYYYGWWNRNLKLSKQDIFERANSIIKVSKDYDSRLVEEMRGISDATNSDLEEIVSINSRYETAWANPTQLFCECTSLAVLPRVTDDGITILAQNWDYRIGVSDSCIILKVKPDNGPTVVMHTEAGIIGQKGLNSKGIGIAINAMVSNLDRIGESVPFFLVCRKMLNSEKFSEAIGAFLEAKRSLSYNIMLAGESVAVNLEAHPKDVSIIYPKNGRIVHTNHFVGEKSLNIKDSFLTIEPHSINRYILTTEKLMTHENHNINSIKEILSNHYNFPSSICHHPNPSNDSDHKEQTLSSVIIIPEKLLLMYTKGPPCKNPYDTINL